MLEQTSSLSDESPRPLMSPVELWTPRVIGVTTLFIGFPGGIILATMNWRRMGLHSKAHRHLITLAAATLVLSVLANPLERLSATIFFGWIGVGVYWDLIKQTKNDIARFKAANHEVEKANWLVGHLIGLVTLAVFVAINFGVAACAEVIRLLVAY